MLKKVFQSQKTCSLTKFNSRFIFKRIRNLFKKQNTLEDDAIKHLKTRSEYTYPLDELKTETYFPTTLAKDKLQGIFIKQNTKKAIEYEQEITELERKRMTALDKLLDTNTYFHEIEDYEERIDSETVMEKKILKAGQKKNSVVLTELFQYDPQEFREQPSIRNFREFAKNCKEKRIYPEHDKLSKVFKNKHETITDEYGYLNLTSEQLQTNEPSQFIDNDTNFQMYSQFLVKEQIYQMMSLLRNTKLEDRIMNEYGKRISQFNVQPLYYKSYVYYTKDTNITGNSPYDLYRTKNTNQDQKSFYKISDFGTSNESLILSEKEIYEFLSQHQNYHDGLEQFLENLMDGSLQSLYYNIEFDKNHEKMAITIEISEKDYIIIFKDLVNDTMNDSLILTDVDDYVVFDDIDGVYFTRPNTLGRMHLISYIDMNKPGEEMIIFEEKDPNFQLKIDKPISGQYLIISSETISGDKVNEVLIRKTNDTDQNFEFCFKREQNTYWTVKTSDDYLYYCWQDPNTKSQQINRMKLLNNENDEQPILLQEKEKMDLLEQNQDTLLSEDSQNQSDQINKNNTNNNELVCIQTTNNDQKSLIFNTNQKSEIFYSLQNNEELLYLEVFKNYVMVALSHNKQDYFNVYNNRLDKMYKLQFDEVKYQIERESPQIYNSQYFSFNLKTPHLPNRIMSYNMGLRQLNLLHHEGLVDYKPSDYTIEIVETEARDGVKIPVTFFYNKKLVSNDSPVLLHTGGDLTQKLDQNFQPDIVSLLDRGIIYAYPHIRGSFDQSEEWFEQGAALKKLTNYSDLIDVANYLLEKEVTQRILGLGTDSMGGLTLATALLREPNLFHACVIDNGIYDIPRYADTLTNNKDSQRMFGDIDNLDIYEYQKEFSPIYTLDQFKINLKNLLITSDSINRFSYQSRSFVTKLRENKENTDVYYKEYVDVYQPIDKKAFQYAFLVNRAFYIQ